jgi:hypothetical protein
MGGAGCYSIPGILPEFLFKTSTKAQQNANKSSTKAQQKIYRFQHRVIIRMNKNGRRTTG